MYTPSSHLLANCDETQASPHFRLVNMYLRALVHCSSELNWILKYMQYIYLVTIYFFVALQITKSLLFKLIFKRDKTCLAKCYF